MPMSVFPQQNKKVALRSRVKEVSCQGFATGESAQALWDQHYSALRTSFRGPLRMLGVPRLGGPRPVLTLAFRPPGRPLPSSAPGALAEAGCSAWAPKLGLGQPPGAESPTFSRQEGGRRRAFPVVHWQQRRRHRSQLLRVAAPGPKFSSGQGGGAQAWEGTKASTASLHEGSMLPGEATWLPALHSGSLLQGSSSPKRSSHLQTPKNTFLAESWMQFPR